MSSPISPSLFQTSFNGHIKTINANDSKKECLIETFDLEKKTQSLFHFSFKKKKIIQSLPISGIYNSLALKGFDCYRILFQKFSNQNNPDLVDVLVFGWDDPEPKFTFLNTRIISHSSKWMQLPHPHFVNKSIYIDLISGKELKDISIAPRKDNKDTSFFPSIYTSESKFFNWFEQFFSKQGVVVLKQVEYLKHKSQIFISYYSKEGDSLQNNLIILNHKGDIKESFLLEEKLPGIGKDTFFILKNKLIFVSQKSTLNIYDL